jgi:hypothetical protein
MSIKIFGVVNTIIAVLNCFVLFMPKKPVSGMHSNAAGGLMLFALILMVVIFTHIILLSIALIKNKKTLLRIMTLLMLPLSLLFWYFIIPMIQ